MGTTATPSTTAFDTTSSASRQHYIDTGEYLPLPVHQQPTSCHVCGSPEDEHATGLARAVASTTGHRFWSNADALREAHEHDARSTVVYPSGATTPEGAFVDEVIGR